MSFLVHGGKNRLSQSMGRYAAVAAATTTDNLTCYNFVPLSSNEGLEFSLTPAVVKKRTHRQINLMYEPIQIGLLISC